MGAACVLQVMIPLVIYEAKVPLVAASEAFMDPVIVNSFFGECYSPNVFEMALV